MRFGLAFFFAAATIAVSESAPVSRAINWSAVSNKLSDIESGIYQSTQQIKAIAIDANPSVGREIANQIDAASVKANIMLEKLRNSVRTASLTEAEAREVLGRDLKNLLITTQAELQDELTLLPSTPATQIRNILDEVYTTSEEYAQQMYALLRQ